MIVNGFGLSPPNADMKHDAVDAFVHAKAFIILGHWNSNDEQGCSSVNVMHKIFVVLNSSAESSANVLCSSKYSACALTSSVLGHPGLWNCVACTIAKGTPSSCRACQDEGVLLQKHETIMSIDVAGLCLEVGCLGCHLAARR